MSYRLRVTEAHQNEAGGFTREWTHEGQGIDWQAARDQRLKRWRDTGIIWTRTGDTYTVTAVYEDVCTTTSLTWSDPACTFLPIPGENDVTDTPQPRMSNILHIPEGGDTP